MVDDGPISPPDRSRGGGGAGLWRAHMVVHSGAHVAAHVAAHGGVGVGGVFGVD